MYYTIHIYINTSTLYIDYIASIVHISISRVRVFYIMCHARDNK